MFDGGCWTFDVCCQTGVGLPWAHGRTDSCRKVEATDLFAPEDGEPPRIDRRATRHGEDGHTADARGEFQRPWCAGLHGGRER